jgi:TetR/AcrR family transcriptional repressor of nem operon
MMNAQTTREKIIELGRNLMQEIGYHSFNYKQIATKINIKNSSIHHYFPSKDDLAVAVIEQDKADFKALTQSIQSQSATEKVQALVDNYTQYFKNGRKLCVISTFGTSFNDVSESIRIASREHGALVGKWFKDVLVDGLATGEFTFKGDPDETTALWMSALPGCLIIGRMHGDEYFDLAMNRLKQTLKAN